MARESDAHALDPLVDGRSFDACYYARSCGRPYRRDAEWLAFFGKIADRIAADLRPRRVLDAGCALGLLVETLRGRDIDAFGIDVSAFAIEHVHEPLRVFCRQSSASAPLGERYDLIVCIEVLEHMHPVEADAAIANFCAHTEDVLFSSSPFDFREATHANVRPPEYWAAEFARHGFYRDVDFDASFITSWAVRFRKGEEPVHRIVSDYERGLSRLSIERNELRIQALETQAELARLTQALDQTRADLDNHRSELNNLRAAHADLATANARLGGALARATATIELMERSWFWRARRPWAVISGWLRGRP